MGLEANEELEGKTWDERFEWVTKLKDEGNKFFKEAKYE
jgi:hypothetical protein